MSPTVIIVICWLTSSVATMLTNLDMSQRSLFNDLRVM